MSSLNVGIVGAGIVGLAYAWSAAERGHRVTVFERSRRAQGASIRNFGMVWPIGQPRGECRRVALVCRERWLRLARAAGIFVRPCGSIHLAHHDDEWAVLQDFARLGPGHGYACSLLSADEVLDRTAGANPQNLIGGLFSPTELVVNPPAAIRAIPGWLAAEFDARFEMQTTITSVDSGRVRASSGATWEFDRVIVCGGDDLQTLFPDVLARSELKLCKLQMLKTRPQPDGWQLGPHLASGLTLRHYRNFEICPSLPALRDRVAEESPELDRYGIHVMASQSDDGCVILGDSHEYDDDIEPFDTMEIDNLILRAVSSIVSLPDWQIEARWHGTYVKHPTEPIFAAEPLPGVLLRCGTGGAGMTMSFGLAERDWEQWT